MLPGRPRQCWHGGGLHPAASHCRPAPRPAGPLPATHGKGCRLGCASWTSAQHTAQAGPWRGVGEPPAHGLQCNACVNKLRCKKSGADAADLPHLCPGQSHQQSDPAEPERHPKVDRVFLVEGPSSWWMWETLSSSQHVPPAPFLCPSTRSSYHQVESPASACGPP